MYINLKNSFYGNDNKEKEFCILVFIFCLITAVCCYIYYSLETNIGFDDWLGFISSVIGILGIPTFFSGLFAKNEISKTEYTESNITKENSKGIKVVLCDTQQFDGKYKFKQNPEKTILYVSNYLHKITGDNLWYAMNKWYESPSGIGKYYPLINAQENNWQGNKEWCEQLSAFIKYLDKNELLKNDK